MIISASGWAGLQTTTTTYLPTYLLQPEPSDTQMHANLGRSTDVDTTRRSRFQQRHRQTHARHNTEAHVHAHAHALADRRTHAPPTNSTRPTP
ncbi:hypothetical protein P170DRAFT_440797 [Aspergillus steynii IBT 23096]|uniref:Uncharacterized protein n=1 Tax=Aspergillus steynii IBT 23096 TaxID=1392250 RepID=A0A2I2FV81_9EURO|nr:uncharacterized protein P170DRAFT_440797 [Aspergillus steynii IBT 23096]PLB44532.1 hypothetical protein P170DRAFT_440797 [Aspergillus steynii IBT 23096]